MKRIIVAMLFVAAVGIAFNVWLVLQVKDILQPLFHH